MNELQTLARACLKHHIRHSRASWFDIFVVEPMRINERVCAVQGDRIHYTQPFTPTWLNA